VASYNAAYQEYSEILERYRQLNSDYLLLKLEVENGASVSDIATANLRLQESIRVQLQFVRYLQNTTIPDIDDVTPDKQQDLWEDAGRLRDQLNDLLDNSLALSRQAANNSRIREAQIFNSDKPRQSSGDTVENEKQGQSEGAQTQSPEQTAEEKRDSEPVTGANTNANTTNTAASEDAALGNKTGTPAVGGSTPEKTLAQTQAGDASNDDDLGTFSVDELGDGTTDVDVSKQVKIANEHLQKIVSQDNILSRFSSVAYSISWYMTDRASVNLMFTTGQKQITTESLLVQSGGIAKENRSPRFDVDFYIEDLSFRTIVGTQGMSGPGQTADISFTVNEPYGISLLERLRKTIEDREGLAGGEPDPGVQPYLMIIRFYGYDENGNLVPPADAGVDERGSDRDAIVEKWIPFIISNITYRINAETTSYRITGVGTATKIAYGQKRAAIPFNLQLSASTVAELLNGNAQFVAAQEPDDDSDIRSSNYLSSAIEDFNRPVGVLASTTPTLVKGLAQALNDYEKELVAKGNQEFANEFAIELENAPGLRDARLAKPGRQSKKNSVNNESKNAAGAFLSNKGFYDKNSRTYTVKAGTMIPQLIDLVMRTSSYVTDQQNIEFDEKTGKVDNKTPDNPTFIWYKVRSKAVPISDRKDRLTGDYAYRTTYTISRYQVNTPNVASFPTAEYRGVHKRYYWIFTGQNTEVLDFEIDVQSNYYIAVGLGQKAYQGGNGQFGLQQKFQSAPNASLQGGENNSTIPAATVAERLYNVADVAGARLRITGDPDWIQQDNVFYTDVNLGAFNADRSINFSSSEALFSILFNRVTDYDLATGLMPTVDLNSSRNEGDAAVNEPTENLVWCAQVVTSDFKNGEFTQLIEGTHRHFRSSKRRQNVDADNTEASLGTPIDNTGIEDFQAEIDTPELPNDYDLADPSNDYAGGGGFRPKVATPGVSTRLQSTGKTTNFNVPKPGTDQPYRDVEVNGQLTRVYGNERDLLKYYGAQGNAPQPGAGENAAPDDGGDSIKANSRTIFTNGWG
jgi:hypothetical protein